MFALLPYCKSFEVEKFCSFHGSISTTNFFSQIACAVGLGHARLPSNHKCFPANYNLVLQPWIFLPQTIEFICTPKLLTSIINFVNKVHDLQACRIVVRTIANHWGTTTEARSSDRVDVARTGDSSTEERIDDALCHQWTTDRLPWWA